jgi:hypothetical protein
MPEMYGIDFLKEIQHLPIKKILITGEKDYKIAVDAFNIGLVDAYVRKDDLDFLNNLQRSVFELEWQYFSELCNFTTNIPSLNYLRNSNFVNSFLRYIDENKVTEFYLTDIDGNFLMRDENYRQTYLLVRSKMQLKQLSEVAMEDEGSVYTIDNLIQANVIPFFGKEKYWQIPANEWDKFLYPATTIPGDDNLVWNSINHL